MSHSLEPDSRERAELTDPVLELLQRWFDESDRMPAKGPDLDPEVAARVMDPPSDEGRPLAGILADLEEAGRSGIYHPSGGHLSYIPNGGLYTSALAEFLAAGLNRYTGVWGAAPGMSAIEKGMVAWMTSLFDMGEQASGLLLSGGSMANFTGIVAARTARLGDELSKGVIYVTPHTHHSVAKAARLAGFRNDQIRQIAIDADLRMDPSSLRTGIAADLERGDHPFLIVGSAGTTDTGTVDRLDSLADIAEETGLWLHVDGAYGGFFQLTERGRVALSGLGRADSMSIDPHKGLSMPFGLGALLVRDEKHLVDANQGRGAYLREEDNELGIRDIASLGPELTRPFRALQMWLPLQLHGVAPFREALDTCLDLAVYAYERLSSIDGVEAPWRPDLSIVAFRLEDDDRGRAALEAVNRDRTAHVSPTVIADRYVLRLAILNRRTTKDHIDHVVDIIEKTLIG
jgi:aromatic-L-amino-acid decarboxylase